MAILIRLFLQQIYFLNSIRCFNHVIKFVIRFVLPFAATVKLPPEKFAASSSGTAGSPSSAPSSVADMPSEPKKVILNSSEELCAELRDKNFHAVGPALSKKAKLISAEFDVSMRFLPYFKVILIMKTVLADKLIR